MANEVSSIWENRFETSETNYPNETVLNEIKPVEQTEDYSCGIAVFTSVYNTVRNEDVAEPELVDGFKRLVANEGLNIEDAGVPPRIMLQKLDESGIAYTVKGSDKSYTDEATLQNAQAQLEAELKKGRVCITPIQNTPARWLINTETNDIEVEWDINPEEMYKYKTVRTNPNWDHVSTPEWSDSEDAILATTKDDVDFNGHYVVVTGMLKHGNREYFITVDPTYAWSQRISMDKLDKSERTIDSKYYGYRFIEKPLFMKKWHDIEGDGEVSNQYFISVDPNQKS